MEIGFDHGVGHPQDLFHQARETKYPNQKALETSGPYSKWPEVADAVIRAHLPALPDTDARRGCLQRQVTRTYNCHRYSRGES